MATLKATVLSCVLTLTAACQLGTSEDMVGSQQQNSATFNGATFNGATFNGATFNAATFNAATFNAATFNAATFNGLDDLANNSDGREYLKYFTRCALPAGQSVTATADDGQAYTFDGLLGLTPEWLDRPLTDSEQNWISACLVAHINALGASIEISLRGKGTLAADAAEMSAFPVYEGTFFGRLYTDEIEVYSCTGDDANVALATSDDRNQRICADDTDDCEVVSLGRCRDVCDTRDANYGWTGCWANGERYTDTLSVYLRSDTSNKTCDGDDCTIKIKNGKAGILDCSDSDDCKAVCKNDSVCAIDATAGDDFRAVVKDDSLADINCHEADECSVRVRDDSSAEIDCKDANDCSNVVCKDDSECLLDCTGAVDCGFKVCQGELTYCPGDIVVCGRGCP